MDGPSKETAPPSGSIEPKACSSLIENTNNGDDQMNISRSSRVQFNLPTIRSAKHLDGSNGNRQQAEQAPSPGEEIEEVVAKPPGGIYTKREYCFVLFAGMFMSFNSGYVNGSCLSGFLTENGRRQAASSFTIVISQAALSLSGGDFSRFGFLTGMTLSFIFGACISGILTPYPTPYRIEPTYGPTFLLGAAFLGTASVLAAFQKNEDWMFFLIAAANGIQNGVSSAYSENLIRSTGFTGSSTDISIYTAQLLRGDTTNFWRLTVLTSLMLSFWAGGLVSFWSTRALTHYSLLINASLFLIIGLSLVAFLVGELGISVKAAFLGTWGWKKAMHELHSVFAQSIRLEDGDCEEQLDDMFLRMDTNGNGYIDAHELYLGLLSYGVNVSKFQCDMMVKHAGKSHHGWLTRAEWLKLAQKIAAKLQQQRLRDSSRSSRMNDSSRRRNIITRLQNMQSTRFPSGGRTSNRLSVLPRSPKKKTKDSLTNSARTSSTATMNSLRGTSSHRSRSLEALDEDCESP